MSVDTIKTIAVGVGTPIIPVWGDGDASADWQETEWRTFGDEAAGETFGGAWEGHPGSLVLRDQPYTEVCIMLLGTVALIDEDGGQRTFTAGDAFVVPKGFNGVWKTLEYSRKVFIAVDPQIVDAA